MKPIRNKTITFSCSLNQEITKIEPNKKGDPWPRIRVGQQAACCLGFGTKHAQLLMSGGRLRQEMPLKDMWMFNLTSWTWREVRCIHSHKC